MESGSKSADILIDRIVKEVQVANYPSGRQIVKLVTHDGCVVMVSGDNGLITSQRLD